MRVECKMCESVYKLTQNTQCKEYLNTHTTEYNKHIRYTFSHKPYTPPSIYDTRAHIFIPLAVPAMLNIAFSTHTHAAVFMYYTILAGDILS